MRHRQQVAWPTGHIERKAGRQKDDPINHCEELTLLPQRGNQRICNEIAFGQC